MGSGTSKGSTPKSSNGSTPRTSPRNSGSDELCADKLRLLSTRRETWQADVLTDPGFGADEESNQDALLCRPLEGGGAVIGIFDGHGRDGQAIAQLCRDFVTAYCDEMAEQPARHSSKAANELVHDLFEALHTHVVDKAGAAANESGASGTVVVYSPARGSAAEPAADAPGADGATGGGPAAAPAPSASGRGTLRCGNVGDTRAVLARGRSRVATEQLTHDHYPTVEAERLRIVECGGRVAASDDVQLGARAAPREPPPSPPGPVLLPPTRRAGLSPRDPPPTPHPRDHHPISRDPPPPPTPPPQARLATRACGRGAPASRGSRSRARSATPTPSRSA